jgi:hypothetical protein
MPTKQLLAIFCQFALAGCLVGDGTSGPNSPTHSHVTTSGGWNYVPGVLSQISVGADGAVWGLNSAGEIYQFNGNYLGVYNGTAGWNRIPGVLSQISVGSAKVVWGINSAGQIFQYNGAGGWNYVPGALTQIAAGANGAVWGINGAGQPFQYNGAGGWNYVPGYLTQISLAPDGWCVWGLNSQGAIFYHNSYAGEVGWVGDPGQLSQIAALDGTAYGVNSAGEAFYGYTDGTWIPLAPGIAHIAAGWNGGVVGLDRAGNAYTLGTNASNVSPPGYALSIGGVLSQISVGSDGAIWGLTSAGQPFEYDGGFGHCYATVVINGVSHSQSEFMLQRECWQQICSNPNHVNLTACSWSPDAPPG